LGDRLVVGRQTLDLTTKVRILVPQPTIASKDRHMKPTLEKVGFLVLRK
jgi:hypothetical protein